MANGLDGDPVGFAAREQFGATLEDILKRFERNNIGVVADTNTAALSADPEPDAIAAVFDQTNNLHALIELQGSSAGTSILAQSGTHFNTASGNAGTLNVYHDGSEYVVENQTTADADLEVAMLRAA